MNVAVNVPTSCGASEFSNLAFCNEIRWADQREFAIAVEQLGFDGIAVPDHLMTGDGPTTECLTTLAALARETEDAYLYPKTVNDQLRHGPLLAKVAAILDNVSEGRLKLGIGAGWKEDEAVAYGYEWPDAPTRLRRLEETIILLKRLWTEETVSFDGDFYDLEEAMCKPHPTQDPRPPIMVGGGGEEFTLRITAKHADAWNYWGSPELMRDKLDVLEDHCETYERASEEIELSWFARCLIRETEEELEELLNEVPQFREENLDEDEFHLVGTPNEVQTNLERYFDMGFNEAVIEFVDFPHSEGAEIFADEVLSSLS